MRTLFLLPWQSKKIVLRAAVLLALTCAGLRLFGFQAVIARILRLHPLPGPLPGRASSSGMEEARRYALLLGAVSRRWPFRARCLSQSVALWWLLRRSGTDSVLHIGVRKNAAALDAHAWVECSGTVLNDTSDVGERYVAFDARQLNSTVQWV